MTTRRFNYTKQQRILQADILVSIVSEQPPTVTVGATLDGYELPSEAAVVLEAYALETESRHDLGTVGKLRDGGRIVLDDFESPEGLRFRIKVLGRGATEGLILAEADRIAPVEEEKQQGGRSFVRVRSGDVGGEAWALKFDSAGPLLVMSKDLGDWKSLLRNDMVRGLMLPAILREILQKAIEEGEGEDDGDWTTIALRRGRLLAGGDPPSADEHEAVEDWIDDACSAFGRRWLM